MMTGTPMPASKTQVVHELMRRGLLSRAAVVDGDVVVADLSSRHQNSLVMRTEGPGYFVKEAQPWQPASVQTLLREASCYQIAHGERALSPLASLMPKLHVWDPQRHMLVLELLPEAENLADVYRRTSGIPEKIAARLGTALGTYHSRAARVDQAAWTNVFPRQQPWVLSFHQQNPAAVANLSAANAQMLSIIQRYPEFPKALDAIRQRWRFETLIHGDMKFENCVVCYPAGRDAEPVLKVIDWEIADIGEPSWDVGGILQAFLTFWVFSMPPEVGADPGASAAKAQFPLEKMRPAIRVFWNAYAMTLAVSGQAERELLDSCLSYGAARMLQTVFESMYSFPQLTPNAIVLLQASLNILQEPRAAAAELLGM
jgi:hypothetical protein